MGKYEEHYYSMQRSKDFIEYVKNCLGHLTEYFGFAEKLGLPDTFIMMSMGL